MDARLAFCYANNPSRGSKAPSIDYTYLCEEKIEDADTAFTKFIHNGDCAPLLEPWEAGYEVVQFLAFTQHVQYAKMKGSAYVSDYQGIHVSIYHPTHWQTLTNLVTRHSLTFNRSPDPYQLVGDSESDCFHSLAVFN